MFNDEVAAVRSGCLADDIDGPLSKSMHRSLYQLLRGSKYARNTGRDVWEFALTIDELRRAGVSASDLRWLVCRGYIEHAEELVKTGKDRSFDHEVSLRFSKRSAFVITNAGVEISEGLMQGSAHEHHDGSTPAKSLEGEFKERKSQIDGNARSDANGGVRPRWDRDRRELRVGSKLIKVFKLPSPMQEAILMAFEEERWPPRIDDPLPAHPDLLPKRRLHDTIKSLNRNQKNCLVRFMGDGTGEGIRWELNSSKSPDELNFVAQ
jgi:hypothetical protein